MRGAAFLAVILLVFGVLFMYVGHLLNSVLNLVYTVFFGLMGAPLPFSPYSNSFFINMALSMFAALIVLLVVVLLASSLWEEE